MPHGLRHMGIRLVVNYLKRYRGYSHLPCSGSWILATLGYPALRQSRLSEVPTYHEGLSFLDYGSGSGNDVALARFLGLDAEGIEIDREAAETGRMAGLAITQGSLDVLEQKSERYDYVMSSHCVEHVVDAHRLFRAFRQALKPNGTLVIEVPNAMSAASLHFREYYYYLGMPVHVHGFTPLSIRILAEHAGLRVRSMHTYNRRSTQIKGACMKWKSNGSTLMENHRRCSPIDTMVGIALVMPVYFRSLWTERGDNLVTSFSRC